MKKEIIPPANQDQNESGVPVQLKFLIGVLSFAIIALVLKVIGIF